MVDPKAIQTEMERTGKLDAVQKLAASADAAALADAVDPEMLRTAAQKQDPAVLRAVLEQVLSTDEGKRLAQKVKAAMEHG